MELRRGGLGSQAVGRRMDGDSRDGGGGGCKDGGSEDYENLPTSASLSTHMTAGAMAGILEHSVMYPVDSVKVRREKTVGTEGAERGACARAFASRARAAWGSALKTPLLRAVAGVGPRPGSRGERATPSAARRGPGGRPSAHGGAPAGAPHRCLRRGLLAALRRGELASAPALGSGGGGGVPEEAIAAALHSLTTSAHATVGLGGSQLFVAPAGAPPVRAAARGVLWSVQGGQGCPHVRSFRGSSPPGSANHAGAEKRGSGSAARPLARVCFCSCSCSPGFWGGVGVVGVLLVLSSSLGDTGSATPLGDPLLTGFLHLFPRSSGS